MQYHNALQEFGTREFSVSRSRNCGTSAVLGVRLDGLDHQIEFVGAVDLPKNVAVSARRGHLGFGEVVQAIEAACRVVSHEQDGTGAVFHPREQQQVIGAPLRRQRLRVTPTSVIRGAERGPLSANPEAFPLPACAILFP